MYVCLCKAITESQISAAVDEGADSLVKLRKKIGVADSCDNYYLLLWIITSGITR